MARQAVARTWGPFVDRSQRWDLDPEVDHQASRTSLKAWGIRSGIDKRNSI